MPVHHDHFTVLQMKFLAVFPFDGAIDFDNGAVRHCDFMIHRSRWPARFHHHHFSAVHHHTVHVGSSGGGKRQEQKERSDWIDACAQKLRERFLQSREPYEGNAWMMTANPGTPEN
jgi:hypothetical protein